MKKLGIMFVMAGIVAFGLSSCGTDDPDAAKPTPKFDFITGAGYTSANTTVAAGSVLTIGIDATGSENLKSVGVRRSYNGGPQNILGIASTGDSSISSLKVKDFTMEFEYEVGSTSGTELITVIVTMDNGETASKTILLTVTSTPKPAQDRPNNEMGGQNNASLGSYWSVANAQFNLQAQANANPEDIDFVYFYGTAGQLATFASPDDPLFNSGTNVMNNPSMATWSPKNTTRFKKTSINYDNVTTSTPIEAEIAAGGVTLTQVKDMKVGDVYIFTTSGSKYFGLIKITAFTAQSGSGSVKFDMKVVSN